MAAQTARADARFRLLGDEPERRADDPLGFDGVVGKLAALVVDSRATSPFTIGIEGGWGAGKSSLMTKLRERLETEPGVRTVWFNAWTAEGASSLEGLVKSVLEKIDPSVLRRVLRRRQLVTWVRVFVSFVAGLLRLGNVAELVWSRASVDPKTRNEMGALVREAMEQWLARRPGSNGHLIVVFVDDLDRCSTANVLETFEAMKLYLDAPGFVFVVGFDPGAVAAAIAHEKSYTDAATPGRYLEKIVQIGYRIPPPTDDQAGALMSVYCEASRTAELFGEAARSLVVERNDRNPRRIKRFLNRFILEYELDDSAGHEEADVLVKLLIFQVYFPDFFTLFGAKSERDPIGEFLDYVQVRRLVRTEPGALEVAKVFESYDLAPGRDDEPAESRLARLEDVLPDVFPTLARNRDFVSLAESLAGEDERLRLRDRARRARETPEPMFEQMVGSTKMAQPTGDTSPTLSDGMTATAARTPTAARVLWIDDEPDRLRRELDGLLSGINARITIVATGGDATHLLDAQPFDVVVSDVTRDDDDEGGFTELETFRARGLHTGPAIFYTSRVTPQRRKRTAELGNAYITNQPSELAAILNALTAPGASPAS